MYPMTGSTTTPPTSLVEEAYSIVIVNEKETNICLEERQLTFGAHKQNMSRRVSPLQ
jgi:hypothetical protein